MDFTTFFAFAAMAVGLLYFISTIWYIKDVRKYNDGFCTECRGGEFIPDGELTVEAEGEGKTGIYEYHCNRCDHSIRTRTKF